MRVRDTVAKSDTQPNAPLPRPILGCSVIHGSQ
jgi:hypothetical protein